MRWREREGGGRAAARRVAVGLMVVAIAGGVAEARHGRSHGRTKAAPASRSASAPDGAQSDLRADVRASAALRLATVEHTIDLLAERERACRARLRGRVRAYYRRERAGLLHIWFDPRGRFGALARRAAVSRILAADLRELALVQEEREAALVERDRLRSEAVAPVPALPPPGSLARPVAGAAIAEGFGTHRDDPSGASVQRRGIRLSADPGDAVVAPASGTVRWAGSLAGSGAVLLDHEGGVLTVLVGLVAPVELRTGQSVARGDTLGRAAGHSVYLEVRMETGTFGTPVDPSPLLGR